MTLPFALWAQLKEPLLILAMATPRMFFTFMFVPFLSSAVLPGVIRSGFAISLALVLYPVIKAQLPDEELSAFQIVAILGKEAFLGMLIGYLAALLFWVVQSIGFFIDTQRGATMAGSFVPLFGDQTSPLGVFLSQTITVLFFIGGGMHVFLTGLYQSYLTWPIFSFFPRLDIHAVEFFLEQFDLLMYLTVFIAAPVVLAMFLLELVMGLISRFVPSLNVFFLAMPIKSGIAFFVLILYTLTLIHFFGDRFKQIGMLFDTLELLLK